MTSGDSETDKGVSRYRATVFRLALAITGDSDSAEDVTQEALIRIHRSERKLTSVDDPLAWVRRVTINCAKTHITRRKWVDELEDVPATGEDTDSRLAVQETLARLPSRHRLILALSFSEGLSYSEISTIFGVPEGTVASRLNAAKAAFQREWTR